MTEPRFDHPALLYRDAAEYLAATTAFVQSALDADQPVLVVVPGVHLRVLRDALADAGDRVAYADMAVAGRNPGRIIPGVLLPLPRPPGWAASMPYGSRADLSEVRAFVRRHAAELLPPARATELVLAAHELTANTVRRTGGDGRITVWAERGLLVCQVEDGGHITDPMVGRVPPSLGNTSGRGLLMVNQICDLVRIHSVPGGTSIRIQMSASGG